jgi:serine protease AprX
VTVEEGSKVTELRKLLTGALIAAFCVFGATAPADAAAKAGKSPKINDWSRKPGDHAKLDRKLNDRSGQNGAAISRAIVTLKAGCDISAEYAKLGGKKGRRLDLINGDVVELPNAQLRKLGDNACVASMHWDRPTGGKMNRAAVVEGARAVQESYGLDGAGIGVAVLDSGITAWHDDLTYQGSNPKVKVVAGQRLTKFVDFVNGRLTPYDDNGHGTHVSGIIAGNGYDTQGARAGMAPAANIVSLKVLDSHGGGYISNVIAALQWAVQNKATYNIRVINLSVGASVTESYTTDPLCLAAKTAVDAGITVVTAAGNLGRNPTTNLPQYGGITAPGNAPWVLTVGAYSHEGTITRNDDKMGPYSSRGPTAVDFGAKPDVVATGTGIVSLAAPGSLFYTTKAAYLLSGTVKTANKPYLSLTGTSMASPIVAGTVALMLQANPRLTPNLVKAIIEYTAQDYKYDALTQGAGFLNTKGAVDLARFLVAPKAGQKYPSNRVWSHTILWGNHRLQNGVIKPAGTAWALNVVWGAAMVNETDNIVWGTNCSSKQCDDTVWGTAAMDADNIVWGTFAKEGDNIVWGTAREFDNIVWGTALAAGESDNIVWGTSCDGADCSDIVWGASVAEGELDNIVWGTATMLEADNIVWGTGGTIDSVIWATSSESDNITWGCSGEETPVFDDPDVPGVFDGSAAAFDSLFSDPAPAPADTTPVQDAPLAILATDTTTIVTVTTTVVGGGF